MGMRQFWESMSGTSKQKYGASLYDDKEMKKWQKEQDKLYGDLGSARTRYGDQANKFLGLYGDATGEADRYRGLAEDTYGQAKSSIGRADSSFGRASSDINRARSFQGSANALMADRDHYSNLKRRADQRRRGLQGDRLEMESIRNRLGGPAQNTGMTQRLLDAFKGANESSRSIMEANTAQLAKTNPAAAARMQQQFNADTLKSVGQLKQQGMVTDQQLSDNNLTREAGLLMNSTALYGQEAAQDQMLAGYQQQQIANYGAAGAGALNTAGAEGDIARGYLAQGSQYAGIGSQYAGMGSQLDARGANALNAGMRYEGMGYGALQDQTSISNRRVERQDKFRLSDAAARARVDSFNNQRANMGLQNTLGLINTGVQVAGAVASGGMSSALTSSINAANAERQRRWDEKRNAPQTISTVDTRNNGTNDPRNAPGYQLARWGGDSPYNPGTYNPAVNDITVSPTSWETQGDVPPHLYGTSLIRDKNGRYYQPRD